MYHIIRNQHAMVADVMGSVPPNIELWRALTGPKLLAWECFRDRVAHIQLSYDVDSFCTSAGVYIPPANSWQSLVDMGCQFPKDIFSKPKIT
jgi:hypothetical protein